MKKKIIRIISGLVLILLVIVGFFAYKEMNDYTNIIRLNRGIDIPKEAKYQEIYSKDSGESFHGDGIRYHIYSYENQETVDLMLDWTNEVSPELENDVGYFEFIEMRLKELNVGGKYYPPLSHIIKFYYKKQQDNSEILILQNDIEKELYIIESFL